MTFRMVAAAVLVSTSAFAQYVATPQQGVPYPTLTAATPIVLVPGSGTPNDRGRATISIPFTFPYFSNAYTSVTVTANGTAFFEPSSGANATQDFPANVPMPAAAEPNGVLAPLWDDLNGNNPGSVVQSQAVTGAHGQGLAIEWKDWSRNPAGYTLTFQIRIWADGFIEFFYGSLLAQGTSSLRASVGIESPSGGQGLSLFGCGSQCDIGNFNPTDGGVTPFTYVEFSPAPGIDLQASRLRLTSITEDAGTLDIASDLTVRNFGTLASGSFSYRLYLSQDTLVDGADKELQPSPSSFQALAPAQSLTASTIQSVERPDGGTYYVLAVVDSESSVTETNEANNVVATSVAYTSGIDLVAQEVSGPSLAGPGDPVTLEYTFTNQGFTSVPVQVPVSIYASVDTLETADDRLLASTTVTVAGGQTVARSITVPLPASVKADNYFLQLRVDEGTGVVSETTKTNNSVFSTRRMAVSQADLVIDSVIVRRAVTPYEFATEAFFGEPIRLEAVVRNQGGAAAPDVTVSFFLSDNQALNGLTDPNVTREQHISLAAGQAKTITVTAPVPTTSTSGAPLIPESYFFFAAAIAPNLAETNAANNFVGTNAIVVRNPAPNIAGNSLNGPFRIGAGEVVPVTRAISNIGNRDAGTSGYRYVLSVNSIITEDDIPLVMVAGDGGTVTSSVTLAVNQIDAKTDLVRVPTTIVPGVYFFGMLVDVGNDVVESNELDNGFAGESTLVIAQALSLSTQGMPDALVGQEYDAKLNANGGNGTYVYEVTNVHELPPGVTLSSDGSFGGTPTTVGNFVFTVRVTSAGSSADARRTVRVLRPTASVAITTTRLPAPIRQVPYSYRLGVAGGTAPYVWTIATSRLPEGLELTLDGVLQGTTEEPLGSTYDVGFRVTDALGNSSMVTLTIAVIDAVPFRIATDELPPGVVGTEYASFVTARNLNQTPVSTPVSWSVIDGQLPPGLRLTGGTTDTLTLEGVPTEPGLYSFQIDAVDARLRSDTATFLVSIAAAPLAVSALPAIPQRVSPGATITSVMNVTPMLPGGQWFVVDGRLPPGITLTKEGALTGTVPDDDAIQGSYTATVGVGLSPALLRGLQPVRIEVSREALPTTSRSCSAAGGDMSVWLTLIVLFIRTAKRRSSTLSGG